MSSLLGPVRNKFSIERRTARLTNDLRNIANELSAHTIEREDKSKYVHELVNRLHTMERTLSEIAAFSAELRQRGSVIEASDKEAVAVEGDIVAKMRLATERAADNEILVENLLDHLRSSGAEFARLLQYTPEETLDSAVDLLAESDQWDVIETLHRVSLRKLETSV